MKSENHSKGAKHRAGAEDDERDRDTTKIEITQKAKFDFFFISHFTLNLSHASANLCGCLVLYWLKRASHLRLAITEAQKN